MLIRRLEVMIGAAEAWTADGSINMKGPLAGILISLKDSIVVGGFDTSVGYSCNVGNKGEKDGTMVRLLKDAGAVPYVKTNLPVTLLSFESTNDVWGGVQILIISSTLLVDQQVDKVL